MSEIQKGRDKKREEIIYDAVGTLEDLRERIPKLFGIPSGIKGLDELFYTTYIDEEDKKIKRKTLGGIPYLSVINITGVSDTGKSLMVEQYAVNQAAHGYKVAFVTVESPSPFVGMGLKERAKAMGFEWEKIENNIILIDAATHDIMREDISTLLSTLEYAISEYNTKSVVIDSITGLFEAKEMMARSVVRKIFNFMKRYKQTALFVSQKRSSHEELSAEAAGGYAISHIVDCSIVLSKELIMNRYLSQMYNSPIGSVIRLFRIDGCRVCGHDTRTHLLYITESGLVEIGPALEEIISR